MSRRRPEPAGAHRIGAVAIVVLSLFAVSALRAAHLQIVAAPKLRARAEDQSRRRLKLLSARGTIYDRHLRELAVSIPGGSVFVDPTELLEVPGGLERLSEVLSLDPKAAGRQLERGGRRFAWLKRRISPSEDEALRALKLPGVGVAQEAHRFYPNRTLAAQLLGFVGLEGEGQGGLEYQYETALRGREFYVEAERDARGGFLLTDAPDPTRGRGRSVVLTIDETIQHIVEEELSRAVESSASKGGWGIALDPATGEILALAENPAFNPNAISSSRMETRKIRATADVYEPGSTFKALFLGILLDQHIVRPMDRVFCENGAWTVHRKTIHDHSPHGWLTVADILKVSSNIGVAKLSERISPEAFYEGLRRYGVGEPSGVDLPGESRGILPPVRTWAKITPKTISFGQGVSATALQVASAVGAIANHGQRMRPHVVAAVLDENGVEIRRVAPEPVARSIGPEAAGELTRMLEAVVQGEGGTAPQAAIPGYTVAGKTGTAWKPDPNGRGYLRHSIVASFVGFVPSQAPRFVLLMAVDEPSKGSLYGGTIAGPAFREAGRRILAYLQVPPEPGAAVATAKPPAQAGQEADWAVAPVAEELAAGAMPDLRGLTMREALRRLQGTGVPVRLTLSGTGVAESQEPGPGTALVAGNTCRIVFRPLL
ncbi:MAG: transpeptidase family protein [Deltaproteobacteria bacterium]|nr:transpeptidase family protein [Deltaproteobacteria bacterium]